MILDDDDDDEEVFFLGGGVGGGEWQDPFERIQDAGLKCWMMFDSFKRTQMFKLK